MKKKFIAAVLAGAVMISGLSVSVMADKEKTFVYGTTGYSEEMGDAGLNPHDNYSGWSALRYGVGETLFKYNDNMEVEPWLAIDYEFVDDTTVKITLRDGVKFSSGRTMDAQAVKECLENLVKVHDRAPSDMKIDYIDADGLTLTIYTTEPCPAIINYLGDPYGAIIDMEYGVQGEGGNANVAGTGPYIAEKVTPTQIDLVKNENYWGGDVKVDKVTVKSFSDGSALTAALQEISREPMVFSMITTCFLTEIRSIPLIPAQQADAFSDSLILSRRSCRIRIYEKPLKWELIKRASAL